jgi:hypothetical protein
MNTEIANLALAHLGVAKSIADLQTEQSTEANVCRRFYEIAKRSVLRSYPWPFATEIVELGLVEEEPTEEWLYSYRYPANALHVRRLLNGIARNETNDVRESYRLAKDNQGKLIYCDKEDAEAEITVYVDDDAIESDDFKMAFSFLLAHYIAPTVTSGDPFKMGERAKANYLEEISKAKGTASNEEEIDALPESEYARGRL